ncbi:hypothetical protein A7K91_05740 [Paenibacillus oryzae]|uniref:histidine kinase n=1 Tax=Paenibacillus oryzae TaxID=1844972 RepID=A0A1A5YHC3_9BACL|nr:HAMP domain-containing sensor histidine kinase [Paenibacillus oryzae]OBR65061.1 hypothetical protein A7K91_05740 [Paenibacillus oryzae]
MWIRKREIKKLSEDIRKIIDGQDIDLRDNRSDLFSMLKNDIHTLANRRSEQVNVLERDQKLMVDMLTNISHQLKTPLTSMLIMIDLLDSAPSDKQAEFITNIKLSLARMDWLVSAFLKMAKIDAGIIRFSRERIQSPLLINLALEPLKIVLDVKNQKVEVNNETVFFCDMRWTAEALTNIIKNASEHSPEGGIIRLDMGTNPICTWISVIDSGAGMTNAEISNAFKKYKGSRRKEGYGIGLPLALAIMRGQNGDIRIDRGNDTGAVFTLKFFK